ETFKKGEEGQPNHFVETKPGTGIFGTIAKLSAQQASKNINDNTIAAHAHHTMYHITVCLSFLEGNEPEVDWSISCALFRSMFICIMFSDELIKCILFPIHLLTSRSAN